MYSTYGVRPRLSAILAWCEVFVDVDARTYERTLRVDASRRSTNRRKRVAFASTRSLMARKIKNKKKPS